VRSIALILYTRGIQIPYSSDKTARAYCDVPGPTQVAWVEPSSPNGTRLIKEGICRFFAHTVSDLLELMEPFVRTVPHVLGTKEAKILVWNLLSGHSSRRAASD